MVEMMYVLEAALSVFLTTHPPKRTVVASKNHFLSTFTACLVVTRCHTILERRRKCPGGGTAVSLPVKKNVNDIWRARCCGLRRC